MTVTYYYCAKLPPLAKCAIREVDWVIIKEESLLKGGEYDVRI